LSELTINKLFEESVDRYRGREFLQFKRGGQWERWTYYDVADRVRDLAMGLYGLGIKAGDCIGIWSENRPEWNVADLAALAVGAVDVPIYTTQARDQIEYILTDSGARAIFVSSTFLAASREIKKASPELEFIICFDPIPADREQAAETAKESERGAARGELKSVSGGGAKAEGELRKLEAPGEFQDWGPVLIDLDQIMADGREENKRSPELYDQLRHMVKPDDLASQLYTSGTTGEPKGVMLSHRNLAANAMNSVRWLELEGRNDIALTYLPFSHIFERGTWYIYMYAAILIAYAESIEAVPQNLQEVRPTLMTSVPRMFEKMYGRILERGLAAPAPRRQIFSWAIQVARDWARAHDRGSKAGPWLALKHKIADALVYKKFRAAVGGRVRAFVSGGAALAPDIAYVFMGAGITILQGYGLTETSPTISANTEHHNRIGTVGRVVKGVEVKIAPDGEILVRGDTVTRGYYNSPELNSEAFTKDGWFRTGDIGVFDEDGYLVITDRKKDLIKTSGGKYIAPQRVESLLMSSRFISQVVVVGNGRKFASALIHPNIEMLHRYASLKGFKFEDDKQLLRDHRVIDLMDRQVDKHSAALAKYEKIKGIALLDRELSIAAGELTPTLKPRRRFIEQKYASLIDGLYHDAAQEAKVL
jgi:long-chain acyl-CoA synthetase